MSAPVPWKYDKAVPSWWNEKTLSRTAAQKLSDFIITNLGFGAYPAAYNRAKHGPFDPRVKYTTAAPEPRLGDVKMGEMPKYLASRSMNPFDWMKAFGRGHSRWQFHYCRTKFSNPGITSIQAIYLFLMPAFIAAHWKHAKHNTRYKHH